MNRRVFFAAISSLALAPKLPGPLRGRTKHFVHFDESAYWEGPLPHRRLYEHFYNQDQLVNRAISLHANFPISSLT